MWCRMDGAHHACSLLLQALFMTASVPIVMSTAATRTMTKGLFIVTSRRAHSRPNFRGSGLNPQVTPWPRAPTPAGGSKLRPGPANRGTKGEPGTPGCRRTQARQSAEHRSGRLATSKSQCDFSISFCSAAAPPGQIYCPVALGLCSGPGSVDLCFAAGWRADPTGDPADRVSRRRYLVDQLFARARVPRRVPPLSLRQLYFACDILTNHCINQMSQ